MSFLLERYPVVFHRSLSDSKSPQCYIARYTDEWNRHRESEIHDIHEIGSGTKLYYLWVKGYSTWGERNTIFLCRPLLHLPQTTCGTPSANYWSGLGGPWKSTFPFGRRNSTLCFFSNPQNPQPALPVHDVIHTPWSHFLILTSVNDASSPRAHEHLRSCLHLTNPCTEPKGSHPN